ncbi:MAG TPA: MFS transporter [Streptosporangiaceae bacterium]
MAMSGSGSVRANRWVILAGYGLLTASTQLLWLAYAPITTQTHRLMGVSTGTVGDLAVIFPVMYVILALPAGRWLDDRFGRALGLGAVLTGAGGLLRLAGPHSFGWALAGQVVISAGQPFVLNAITKVAARYFPESERTTAISVGSVALFVGILAAALSSGPLLDAGGLALLLWVQAAVAVVAAVWVLATIGTPAAFTGDPSVAVSLRWLRRDRFMWVLAGLLFVGIGVFNVVATWLDSILTHFGHGGASGPLIALMTVGGIAGAAVLPGLVARRQQRRAMLQVAVVVTALAFAVIAAVHSPVAGGVVLFVSGFFLLAGLPVVLDWSELHAGPERAASAAGFLLLAGNLGGVVLVLIVQAVIGNPYASLGVLVVAGLAGLALSFRLPARGVGTAGSTDAAAEGVSQ